MSYMIPDVEYVDMIEHTKQKALDALEELKQTKLVYGTLPYMLDVEAAIKVVEAIRLT